MTSLAAPQSGLLRQYLVLTKPRVTQLAVFCAVIGMFLAAPGIPDMQRVLFGTLGIWLLAAAAFAINCLIEQEVDARMLRTARRATARGTISAYQVLSLSGLLGGAGMFVLYHMVNPLTMWLTFATFVGYAVIYTVILKPRTPQNIVIGGLSGHAARAGLGRRGGFRAGRGLGAGADHLHLDAAAFLGAGAVPQPRLRQGRPAHAAGHAWPAVHAPAHPALQCGAAGHHAAALHHPDERRAYLTAALVLGGMFLSYAWRLYREYSDELARSMFRFSILYLALLFGALLVDHWVGLLR